MKPFTAAACVLLGVIAVLQLVRFAAGWEVTVDGHVVPVWASGVAALVAGTLAAMTWRESRR